MKQFYHKVDRRSRKAMTDFLENHFLYSTMRNWNNSTSYANNVKIWNLGLTHEQEMKLYEIIDCDGAYDEINDRIWDFGYEHDWQWQVGFNGRSGGYLVLYKGGWKQDEHKSYCTSCCQQNFTSVEETGCKCGRCGRETRVDFKAPRKRVFCLPGQSVDMHEDFTEWTMDDLKNRVKLVEEFDMLCDEIVEMAAYISDNFSVEEEEVMVPHTRKALREVSA